MITHLTFGSFHLYEKNIFKEDCINIRLQYLAIIEIIKNHDLQEITLNNIDAETIKKF